MTEHRLPTPHDDSPAPRTPRLNRTEWIAISVLIVLAAALVMMIVLRERDDDRSEVPSSDDRGPRVAYLGPADTSSPDVFLADIASGEVTQLTTSEHGVEDFAVSPSGAQIAYTRNNGDGTSDIWLVDVAQMAARPLTACVNARCSHPAWHPDETQIVYQRRDYTGETGTGLSAARAWIVDVRTVQTWLLFDDAQVLGVAPQWSPGGDRIAVFDPRAGGIRVYNLALDDDRVIPIATEVSGTFSPDGSRLLYPVLVRGLVGQSFYTQLEIMDFATGTTAHVSEDEDTPVEDGYASWSPDGSRLVVARRYLDDRFTTGKQVYVLDVASGEATPLVVDAQYTHAAPQWDSAGQRVVYQRFDLLAPDSTPDVWVYDTATGRARQIAANAFFPAWVP